MNWAVICDAYVSHWPDADTAHKHKTQIEKGALVNKCRLTHVVAYTDLPRGSRLYGTPA